MHRKPFVLLSAVTLLCSLTACSDPFADVECSPVRNKLCPSGQTCVDNTCRPVCDRASQCSSSEACIDNACVAYSAKCTTLDGCVEGWTCNLAAGSCEKLAPLGAACTSGTACASGFCVDSRCCESACDGTCVSCNGSVTGDADGVCANVPVGQDPRDDCIDPVACDGAGACAAGQVGDPCTGPGTCDASFCVDGVCCATACQGTCQSCSAALTGGTDGTCAPTLLGEDPDDECTGALACDGDGECFAKVQGDACTENYECSTGFCVDGFCCDSACDATCYACAADITGADNGTCTAIPDTQDHPDDHCPGNTACNGSGECYALAISDACTHDYKCTSGHCVDGVCCETACDDECHRCDGMNVPGEPSDTVGKCEPVAVGEDPDDDCPDHLACNSKGACYGLSTQMECKYSFECLSADCCGGVCQPDWTNEGEVSVAGVFTSLWGTAVTDLWATAEYNGTGTNPIAPQLQIKRYDGTTWTGFTGTVQAATGLRGYRKIHGTPTGSTIMLLASNVRMIAEYNGVDFIESTYDASVPDEPIEDLLVLSDTEAYALGPGCNLLRWNGTTWSRISCPTISETDYSTFGLSHLVANPGGGVAVVASATSNPPPPFPSSLLVNLLVYNNGWSELGPRLSLTTDTFVSSLAHWMDEFYLLTESWSPGSGVLSSGLRRLGPVEWEPVTPLPTGTRSLAPFGDRLYLTGSAGVPLGAFYSNGRVTVPPATTHSFVHYWRKGCDIVALTSDNWLYRR